MIPSLIAEIYYIISKMTECEHKELRRVGKSLVWTCPPCSRFFGTNDVTESVTKACMQRVER